MSTNRLALLQQYLKESPDDAFILFALAKEYEKLNELGEALSFYEKLKTEQPNYVGTYYHLGKLLEKLERPADAFAIYKLGMQIAKQEGDQHSLSELAGAKLNLGDDDDFE